jgi:hypothetical protein
MSNFIDSLILDSTKRNKLFAGALAVLALVITELIAFRYATGATTFAIITAMVGTLFVILDLKDNPEPSFVSECEGIELARERYEDLVNLVTFGELDGSATPEQVAEKVEENVSAILEVSAGDIIAENEMFAGAIHNYAMHGMPIPDEAAELATEIVDMAFAQQDN